MSIVRSFARKMLGSRSLYLQLLFVTLAFALLVVSSCMFVNNMLMNYLSREAVNILTQAQIRIVDELREPETLMISIVKDVRDIILNGGSADDVLEYYNGVSAELSIKEHGFVFDGLHGYFEALGNVYVPAPGWIVPGDYSATERPWYKAAVEAGGRITATPIYLSLRSGEYQINFACRIFDDQDEPLGVVTMNVRLDNIAQFVADMRLVEGGYGFLANENFVLVAHRDADLLRRPMSEISPGSRRIVEMMERGESFVKVESDNYMGLRSIIYCQRIDNGWHLGLITPRSVYYKDFTTLMLFLGVLGALLTLAVNIILIRLDAVRSKSDEAFKASLDKRLEQQTLMTYISQSFLSTEEMDVLITKALSMVGGLMGIDQILMFVNEEDGTSFNCRNEWINPSLGLPTRLGGTFKMSEPALDIIIKSEGRNLFHVSSNDPDVRKAFAPYRVNFHNYILAFVFLGGKLFAILDFSRGGPEKLWDQDEINMASYMMNILVGALNKRSAELQLIAAKESAEQSNRAKGIFLANMSHEIRTPMSVILGVSEIQLQDKTIPPGVDEAFRRIYDSGSLLLNIINDILDFSKIEAGKLEIVPVKYDIPSLLSDAVELNRLRYESKPIKFKLDVDENTPLELHGDELRIKQILNNLLSNAFKYTDKGEVDLSVRAEQGRDEEAVTLVFQVSDTGQGMREDQVNRLFDEYARFNMNANRGVPGTGLGMSIVKRLIDMMDGEIFVESKVGEGSTFAVRLPQKRIGPAVCGAELADSLRNFSFRSAPISEKAQIEREYMPYGRVLVVDDVASNLYVARGLLTPYGLRIETAESGLEAIEKIENGGVYDIVFMDHMMPVMDGMQATKVIRGLGYARPVVALTANAVVGQADIFLANGFDGFISKPIDSRELDAMLNRLIRDKQPREVIEAALREQRRRETGNPAGPAPPREMSDLERCFVSDAEKIIKAIEAVYAELQASDAGAMDAYITAVHGIKSALANIGETELSGVALRLERAGNERNLAAITEETPALIDALRLLIAKFKPAGNDEAALAGGPRL